MLKKFYGAMVVATSVFVASQPTAFAANLTVVQQDLPVGTNITVAGVKYQIMQFEIPAFDTDKIYLLKFPVYRDTSQSANSYYSQFFVQGHPVPYDQYLANTINKTTTGLSGFKAFYEETYSYSAYYSGGSSYSNNLYLSNRVWVRLDSKTYVSLGLGRKQASQMLTGSVYTPDTSTKLHATPTALTYAQRNKFLLDSRALYKYISIREKL